MSSLYLRRFKPILICLLVVGALVLSVNHATWASLDQSSVHAQTVPPKTTPGPVLPTDPNAPVTAPSEPLPDNAVREVVRPGVEAIVTSSDGQISVSIPRDALNFPGTLQVNPVDAASVPPGNGLFQFAGEYVKVDLFDATGNLVINPTFATPIQVCMDAGTLPGNDLVVRYYDTTAQVWVSLPSTFDPATNKVCGSVTHLTLFALTEDSTAMQQPSVASTAMPDSSANTSGIKAYLLSWWQWIW